MHVFEHHAFEHQTYADGSVCCQWDGNVRPSCSRCTASPIATVLRSAGTAAAALRVAAAERPNVPASRSSTGLRIDAGIGGDPEIRSLTAARIVESMLLLRSAGRRTEKPAPPPPDFNAAVRAARGASQPEPVYVPPSGIGVPPPPSNEDFREAVLRLRTKPDAHAAVRAAHRIEGRR